MGLYLSLNLGQTSPVILASVDFPMTLLTNGHLLSVNSRHIKAKALQVLAAFADVFDVVHLDPFRAVADGTVVQQSGLGSSREPGRDSIQVNGYTFGFLDLLERLVEEVN